MFHNLYHVYENFLHILSCKMNLEENIYYICRIFYSQIWGVLDMFNFFAKKTKFFSFNNIIITGTDRFSNITTMCWCHKSLKPALSIQIPPTNFFVPCCFYEDGGFPVTWTLRHAEHNNKEPNRILVRFHISGCTIELKTSAKSKTH